MAAEVGSAFVRVRPNLVGFKKELHDGVRDSFSGLDAVVATAVKGTLIGVGAIGAAVGIAGFQFDDLKQRSQIAFETLLGSAEKAQKMMDSLTRFAATTPFELKGLIPMAQQLLNVGFTSEQVIPTLTAVGDAVSAAGGDPEKLASTVRALGQIQSKGRVMAEEMMQLNEAGTFSWNNLAKAIGTSVPEAQARVQAGTVSSAQFMAAFVDSTEKRLGGLMDKTSHTFTGVLSNLKDAFSRISGTVMQPLFELATQGMERLVTITNTPEFAAGVKRFADMIQTRVVPAIKEMVRWLVDHADEIKQFFVGLVDAVRAVVGVLGGIATKAFEVFRSLGLDAGQAAKAVGIAFVAMRLAAVIASAGIRQAMISTGIGAIAVAAGLAAVAVIEHWETVRKWFVVAAAQIQRSFDIAWGMIREAGKQTVEWMLEAVRKILGNLETAFGWVPGLGGQMQSALKALDEQIAAWAPNFEKVMTDAGTAGGDALGKSMLDAYNKQAAQLSAASNKATAGAAALGAGGGRTTGGIGQVTKEMLNEAAAIEGIPASILFGLIKQESHGIQSARSPAGAFGVSQLMPGTAAGLAKTMKTSVGELRTNVGANVKAGARYLGDMYRKYGDWEVALAAYNAGPGAVDKALAKGGRGNFLAFLSSETRKYVPSVLDYARASPTTAAAAAPSAGMAPVNFASRVTRPSEGLKQLQATLGQQGLLAGTPSIDYPGHSGGPTSKTPGGVSFHYSGEALDISGSPASLARTWEFLKQHKGAFAELFYKAEAYENGRAIPTVSGHGTHIHVAYTGTKDQVVQALSKLRAPTKVTLPKPATVDPDSLFGATTAAGGATTAKGPKERDVSSVLYPARVRAALDLGQRPGATLAQRRTAIQAALKYAQTGVKNAKAGSERELVWEQEVTKLLNDLDALRQEIATDVKARADKLREMMAARVKKIGQQVGNLGGALRGGRVGATVAATGIEDALTGVGASIEGRAGSGRAGAAVGGAADSVGRQAGEGVAQDVSRTVQAAMRAANEKLRELAKKRAEILKEIAVENTRQIGESIKESMASTADALRQSAEDLMANIRKGVDAGRSAATDAFQRFTDKVFRIFDAQTQKLLDEVDAKARSALDAAEKFAAGETPEEGALRAFRAAREAEQRARERAAAGEIEDPTERAARIHDLDLRDQEDALVAAAEASRQARDAELQARRDSIAAQQEIDRKAIQDERDALKERLGDRLAAIQKALGSDEPAVVANAKAELIKIMGSEEWQTDFSNSGALLGTSFAEGFNTSLSVVQTKVEDLAAQLAALQNAAQATAAAVSGKIGGPFDIPHFQHGGEVPAFVSPGETIIDRSLTVALKRLVVGGDIGPGGTVTRAIGSLHATEVRIATESAKRDSMILAELQKQTGALRARSERPVVVVRTAGEGLGVVR